MEPIPLDIEYIHLFITDLDALWIIACVQLTAYDQAGPGRRGCDQLDHGFPADQRFAAPGLRDVTEQPVLSSRPGEFHPQALPEPYVKLSPHTAPYVRPPPRRNPQ